MPCYSIWLVQKNQTIAIILTKQQHSNTHLSIWLIYSCLSLENVALCHVFFI